MALESGKVNSYREGLVLIRFPAGAAIECVVDTGFDGALMLPRVFVSQIQIPIIGKLTFEMVGGARMSAEVGLTDIDWLGRLRQVEVIVSEGDDALVGTVSWPGLSYLDEKERGLTRLPNPELNTLAPYALVERLQVRQKRLP